MTEIDSTHSYDLLYFDTCKIIEEARDYAYRAVNVALTLYNPKIKPSSFFKTNCTSFQRC